MRRCNVWILSGTRERGIETSDAARCMSGCADLDGGFGRPVGRNQDAAATLPCAQDLRAAIGA